MDDCRVNKIGQQVWLGPMEVLAQSLEPYMDESIRALASTMGKKRQLSVLVGRSLLKYALVANGLLTADQPLPEISYTPLRKPFFVNLPVHFNLSHSHGWIALALGDAPQGIDLELINLQRRLRPALLKKVLLLPELSFLHKILAQHDKSGSSASESFATAAIAAATTTCELPAALPSEAYDFFFLHWTLKECLLKLQGSSIFALERLQIDPEQRQILVKPLGAHASHDSQENEHCSLKSQSQSQSHSQALPLSSTTSNNVGLSQDTVQESKSHSVFSTLERDSAESLNNPLHETIAKSSTQTAFTKPCHSLSDHDYSDSGLSANVCSGNNPSGHSVSANKVEGELKPQELTWFKYLFSYKLSTLIAPSLVDSDFWLTVGSYSSQAPQFFVFSPKLASSNPSLEDTTHKPEDLDFPTNQSMHQDMVNESLREDDWEDSLTYKLEHGHNVAVSEENKLLVAVDTTTTTTTNATNHTITSTEDLASRAHTEELANFGTEHASHLVHKDIGFGQDLLSSISLSRNLSQDYNLPHKACFDSSELAHAIEFSSYQGEQNATKKKIKMPPLSISIAMDCASSRAVNSAHTTLGQKNFLRYAWQEVQRGVDMMYSVDSL